MAIFIKVNGKMIKQTDMELTLIHRHQLSMKEIGKMTCSTVREYNCMLMEINTKVLSNREEGTGKEDINLLMAQYIQDNGSMERYKDKEFAYGRTRKSTKADGLIIKKTERENTHGLMGDAMKESIKTI